MVFSCFKNCLSILQKSSNKTLVSKYFYSSKISNKVVFILQSENIFSNLAFEEWLYQNWNFKRRHALLLWRNSPCVVIGKHQNPHKEINLDYLEKVGIPFARRQSGGGTVYHDLGNLNCTFFSPREGYNRRWNLEVIQRALRNGFGVDVQINSRHDIVMGDNLKVSGSAAKLGREIAYHHCSLLFNTDHKQLSLSLKGDLDIETNATESVKSKVGNLCTAMNTEGAFPLLDVFNKIAFEYLDSSLPGEENVTGRQVRQTSDGISLISPRDDWFPGLYRHKQELMSWDWLYGKTPRFTKTLRVKTPEYLVEEGADPTIDFIVEVKNGLLSNIQISANQSHIRNDVVKCLIQKDVIYGLKGVPYSNDLVQSIDSMLRLPNHEDVV